MKHLFYILFISLISVASYAQNGFNYKASIKDALGNVVANQTIQMELSIISGSPSGSTEYTELHEPTTDANGIINICIGEGTPENNDIFSNIKWKDADHFLNVKVDIGNGFTDMGTTQFKYVPYAASADNAPTNAVITSPRYLDLNYSEYTLISGDRVRIEVNFNIRMNQTTFILGDSVTLSGSGGSATGTLTWQNGGTRLVITTNESFTTLSPCFSGGLTLIIKGDGANVLDINNRPIDGDLDGHCGGDYSVTFDILC